MCVFMGVCKYAQVCIGCALVCKGLPRCVWKCSGICGYKWVRNEFSEYFLETRGGLHGCARVYMGMYGCAWMCTDVHGFAQMYMDMHGCAQVCVGVFRCMGLPMGVHVYAWLCVE